jgi:hypothetical protein
VTHKHHNNREEYAGNERDGRTLARMRRGNDREGKRIRTKGGREDERRTDW